MYQEQLLLPPARDTRASILSAIVITIFRHRRFVLAAFAGIALGTIFYVSWQPTYYEAQMKIILNRGRVDSVVSSGDSASPRPPVNITREEVNTELELLMAQDVLQKVAQVCGLIEEEPAPSWWDRVMARLGGASSMRPLNRELLTSRAASKLRGKIESQPMRDSNVIRSTYTSTDPELAARVLNALGSAYLEKHTEVHRPKGTYEFFRREAERHRQLLRGLEWRMSNLVGGPEAAAPMLLKESTLRKMAEFEAEMEQTRAGIAAATERVEALEKLAASVPPRTVTEIRTSSKTLEGLQSTLVELELKRTQLLKFFQPGYPDLDIVESQIQQTRKAIEGLQNAPPTEQITDRDPAYELTRSELIKARAELSGLAARARALESALAEYGKKVQRLAQMEIAAEDLVRQVNLAKENYLLYIRKQEDARIADELDRSRIVNVTIAEPATVPFAPAGPNKAGLMLLGGLFAVAASVGLALVVDRYDRTLRTPEEVEACFNVPVVAVLPKDLLELPGTDRGDLRLLGASQRDEEG